MGRHQGPGGRPRRRGVARLARVAAVVGFVGVTGAVVAVPAMAQPNLVAGTPCTSTARACVDLVSQKAWLIDKTGKVIRGPLPVTSGGTGKETPVGTFRVQWKDKDHKSSESRLPNGQPAPMPWSVFFAEGGIAFHGGSLQRASSGCVHLADADAQAFYETLQLGDEVQVRAGGPTGAPSSTSARPSSSARSSASAEPSARSSASERESSAAPRPSTQANASAATPSAQRAAGDPSSDRQPSAHRGSDAERGLDLRRSPVGDGALSHGL